MKECLSKMNAGAVIFDRNGLLIWANPFYTKRFGVLQSPGFLQWLDLYNSLVLIPFWDDLLNEKGWHGEAGELHNGLWVEHDIVITPVPDKQYLAILTDISKYKRDIVKATSLATQDVMTGLANRAYFDVTLSQKVKQSRRGNDISALLLIDLDGFKSINDTYGHDAGDSVLKITAERMRHSVRETDFCARIGGDEFCCIVSRMSNAFDVESVASKLIKTIALPIPLNEGMEVSVGASIGIAMFGVESSLSVNELYKEADGYLYAAKRSGKNTWRGDVSSNSSSYVDHSIDEARKRVHSRINSTF